MVGIISEGLAKFYQQYPRIPVVVTAQAGGRKNAMVVARHTAVSNTPPTFGVSLQSGAFTYQLIAESKEFGVNFLPFEEAQLVDAIGSSKGREIDKFSRFDIAVEKPVETAVPILKAAYAAYECKVIDDRSYGGSRWVIGEVVAMHALKECLAPQQILDLDKVNPLLYLGEQHYLTTARDTVRRLEREVNGKA